MEVLSSINLQNVKANRKKKKKKVDKCSPAPLDALQSVNGLFNPDSRASPLQEVPAV